MKSLTYVVLASALPVALAQSSSSDAEGIEVWAAVAYINHGDKTPYYGPNFSLGDEELVPEGAQQLWRQGTAFRARYIDEASGDGNSSVAAAPIQGISNAALDNAQVGIASTDDQWAVAGALAFMQGLYPPTSGSVTGDMAHNLAGDGDGNIDFPLDGYQYPLLLTLSPHDKNSPGIQGTVGCTSWVNQTQNELREREDMKTKLEDTLSFYQDLVATGILAGSVSQSDGNFWNAYEIYEWARYMYTHNETVFEGWNDADEKLDELEANALTLAHAKLTTPSVSTGASEKTIKITTVAGRTLAKRVLDQLKGNIRRQGSHDKLSVMFGSYEPMLSFLSLAGILTRENLRDGPFSRLPRHGAALVVELISTDDGSSDVLPSEDDLRVRFYYREDADEATSFESYSMLGSGMSGESIPYTSFARAMTDDGLGSNDWCTICNAQEAPFCPTSMNLDEVCENGGSLNGDDGGSNGSGMYGSGSTQMSPAVAGVIGAAIFGAVAGLVAACLYFLAGVRIRRVGAEHRASVLGGFRGAEKKPDDADVEVTGGGAQHPRIGSWELRGGDLGAGAAAVKGKGSSKAGAREVNPWREDDEVSLVGATPVAVREGL